MSGIAEQLRQLRLQHGLRLSDLAARTGYSEQYLSDIERGKRASLDATIATLNKILAAYDRELVMQIRTREE